MTTSSDRVWPAWSVETAPADLARYVVPEVVRQHAQLPGPSGALVLARVRAVWDGLRGCGIGYAHEPPGSGADGQWIRPPAELLVAPRNGTCLDLAVLLAGALDHAGLRTAVVVLDAVAPGRPGHALVAVLLGESWPGDPGGDGVWLRPPPGFHDAIQTGPDAPPNDVLVLDPDGIAHALAERDADGTDVDLALAAATGAAHLTSGRYVWRLGVVVDRADPFRPAPLPQVLPLRDPYREPATAESALRLLRAEYRITPFQGRDELTVLSGLCEETVAGRRTGVAVVTGRGGAGKTRLGLELVRRMAQAGWHAGVLREQTRPGPTLDWLAEVTAPLLVMIDYADARASSVIEVLRVVATRPRPAVVVLTARAREGEWLTRITDAMETDAHPYRLETVDLPDVHPRAQDVFARTHQALTTAPLPLQGGRPRQLPTPSKGTRWTTLDLVLLGWLTAQGEAQLPVTPADLYDQVLRHEPLLELDVRERHGDAAALRRPARRGRGLPDPAHPHPRRSGSDADSRHPARRRRGPERTGGPNSGHLPRSRARRERRDPTGPDRRPPPANHPRPTS